MSTPADVKKETTRQIARQVDPGHFVLYAGGTRVQESFFDIRIVLGESAVEADGSINFVEKMTVVFSPQHAKVFMKVFADKVKGYEDKYGEINIPEKLLSTLTLKSPKVENSQLQ